jgi:serine/threonine-protein kinase
MSASRDQRRHLYEQLVGTEVAGGRYTITALLGFGGMGAVYEAIQRNMDRKVALKLIPTHDPTIVARFEREALTISKLQHPNTVTVFDFGQGDDGFLFLAMELLDGRTLSDAIKEGPLTARRAVHITSQICRSLGEAHRSGIVHRDIKPDNIILIRVDQDYDFVKVLDFGIAKAVMGEDDVQLTGDGRIIGTPRYMSPEQILAEPLDHRSDIYSLGCILYEMLCGAPPFEQSSTTALMISHTQDPPPTFAQRLDPSKYSMMPPAVEQVVRKALSKRPGERHQNTDELREELEAAIEGRLAPTPIVDADSTAAAIPSSMSPSTGSQPVPVHITQSSELAKPKEDKTNPLVYAIVALLLVIGGLVAYAALAPGDDSTTAEVPSTDDPFASAANATTPAETTESVPGADEPSEKARPGWVTLDIKGTPPGATVTSEGKVLGKTPMVTPVKRDREIINLVISQDGYHDQQIGVPIDTDKKRHDVAYELERKTSKRKPKTRVSTRPKPTPPKPEPKKDEEVKETTPSAPTSVELIDDSSDTKVDLLLQD